MFAELNRVKAEMAVHPESRHNTKFYSNKLIMRLLDDY